MTSFVTTKACGLTQPSTVVSFEVCSDAILRDMSIFLKIMTTISCIVIPIVRVYDHVGLDLHSKALCPYF